MIFIITISFFVIGLVLSNITILKHQKIKKFCDDQEKKRKIDNLSTNPLCCFSKRKNFENDEFFYVNRLRKRFLTVRFSSHVECFEIHSLSVINNE